MAAPTLADLLTAGRFERITADPTAARDRLDRARRHLATAARLIAAADAPGATDPLDADVVLTTCYDAARQVITAHALAHGLRATGKPGHHAAVGVYAVDQIPDPVVGRFDAMRRRRNKIEYGDALIGEAEARTALRHATAIADAVDAALSASGM